MKSRIVMFTALILVASHALAQTPAPRPPVVPAPPAAPAPPARPQAAPAPPAANAPAPPPAPPAPAPLGSRQPINIKVEVTFSEEGGGAAPLRKIVSTVAGDGFSGSVREMATLATPNGSNAIGPTALNVDASPVILSNGKLRVALNFQYSAGQSTTPGEARARTDIRQSLVLVLESGKSLKVTEATDPLSDRKVNVEVTATILK